MDDPLPRARAFGFWNGYVVSGQLCSVGRQIGTNTASAVADAATVEGRGRPYALPAELLSLER